MAVEFTRGLGYIGFKGLRALGFRVQVSVVGVLGLSGSGFRIRCYCGLVD